MTLVVDFDGTCVTHEYPEIGKDIGAAPVLKRLSDKGHKIILFTMRSEPVDPNGRNTLREALDWFERKGIKLYGINENPSQKSWTKSPKAHGDIYLDDHTFGAPLKFYKSSAFYDWEKVAADLNKAGIFSDSETEDVLSEIKNEISEAYPFSI